MTTLAGKVALVTGGASGIGEATVRRLVAEGATVAIVDTNDERGAALAGELGARFVRADVAEPADWRRVVDDVCSALGGLDLAHLNAGTSIGQPNVAALSDEDYRRIMRANVDGVVFGMRAVVPAIAARGGGAVVVTASLAGLIPIAFDPVYALTKHGVVGLVRSLAPTLAEQHITVNCVVPGTIATERGLPGVPERPAHRAAPPPIGRRGEAEEVAAMVRMLCGPDARYITGQAIHVNGGGYMP